MKKTKWKFNWKETRRNKIYAILLVVAGALPLIFDRDITALIFTIMIGLPLFFTTKKYID